MELKELLEIIKKRQIIFWLVWFGVLILAISFLVVQPKIYRGEFTVLLSRLQKSENNHENQKKLDYDYYYQLEANQKMSKILLGVLKDRPFLDEMLKRERIKINFTEADWMIKKVKGEILGPGYLKIEILSHQEKNQKKIYHLLKVALEERIKQVATENDKIVVPNFSPLKTGVKVKPYLLVGIFSFSGGLLVAVLVILFIYWREGDKNNEKKK